jgi:putative peptidoglycan lipid II flippase
MRALFQRGKFTSGDAVAAAQTLAAYATGLIPFVLIRSMTAPFYARGDTATPVKASLTAVAINVGFKILLMGPLAQVGLAIATAIGAWVNLGLILWFAARAGILGLDARVKRSIVMLGVSGMVMAVGLYLAARPVGMLTAHLPVFRDESALIALAAIGAILYCILILVLLGRHWLRGFLADIRPSGSVAKGD